MRKIQKSEWKNKLLWLYKRADEENGSQQSPEDFVSRVMDKTNEEDVAVAEAEGKAIIKNNNINVVVYI